MIKKAKCGSLSCLPYYFHSFFSFFIHFFLQEQFNANLWNWNSVKIMGFLLVCFFLSGMFCLGERMEFRERQKMHSVVWIDGQFEVQVREALMHWAHASIGIRASARAPWFSRKRRSGICMATLLNEPARMPGTALEETRCGRDWVPSEARASFHSALQFSSARIL